MQKHAENPKSTAGVRDVSDSMKLEEESSDLAQIKDF